jgi:eukaryotic-like serine/threonine-protein kinase
LNVVVEVIDVDAQAIAVQIAAATSAVPIDDIPTVEVFKGPYSSAAVSDRIEAALFLCLDQVQRGVEGVLNLDDLGGA